MGKYTKAKPREKIVRDIIVDKKTLTNLEKTLRRTKVISAAELARQFNLRISIAKKILRDYERKGILQPLVKCKRSYVYVSVSSRKK